MTEYRRYQGKSYMIWKGEAAVEGYEYPMLIKNRILGLLPLQMTNADEQMQFWYDISGKQSLEDWVKMKKPGSGFLKKFITALAETLERTGEYLLFEDGISLVPERIYLDAEENEIDFCYMPFEKADFEEAMRGFMEYYLSHMEHGSREGIQICYAVYEKCQQEHTTIDDLLAILYREETAEADLIEEEQPKKTDIAPEAVQKQPEKKHERFWENIWKRKHLQKMKKKPEQAYAFEPEEFQTKSVNPTVFLGSETDQTIGELKYEGEGRGKNLPITEETFLIGSQAAEVDGVISEDTISRIHARITKENDCFYLEDMNSTNGTYRNGELLNYREKVQLEKNDRIMFAKESYRFV